MSDGTIAATLTRRDVEVAERGQCLDAGRAATRRRRRARSVGRRDLDARAGRGYWRRRCRRRRPRSPSPRRPDVDADRDLAHAPCLAAPALGPEGASRTSSWSEPVGRDRAAAVGPAAPGEVGEAAAGLATIRSSAATSQSARTGSAHRVGRALGDQHVAPEVAEAPRPPAPADQGAELVAAAELVPPRRVAVAELRVGEVVHAGHVDRVAVRERAAAARRPPAPAQRRAPTRRRPRARRPPRARSASPRPGRRARSSWCRRSGR